MCAILTVVCSHWKAWFQQTGYLKKLLDHPVVFPNSQKPPWKTHSYIFKPLKSKLKQSYSKMRTWDPGHPCLQLSVLCLSNRQLLSGWPGSDYLPGDASTISRLYSQHLRGSDRWISVNSHDYVVETLSKKNQKRKIKVKPLKVAQQSHSKQCIAGLGFLSLFSLKALKLQFLIRGPCYCSFSNRD